MTAKPGIIYLQKDKFQLFSPFLRQIVEFRFVPEIVRDSDVINSELLESLVKVFVENTKIPPGNLTIVLADNTYFVKDFVLPAPPPPKPGQPPTPQQMTMETISVMSMDFVEHVPYENVVSLTIPLKNGLKVCAVNKDFYGAISSAFEKLGFTIDAVYPGLVLGNNLTTKPVLDTQLVSAIFQKAGSMKQYDLLAQKVFSPEVKKVNDTESIEEVEQEIPQDPKKPNKKRLFSMVGLLAVLLIILAIVAKQSMTPPPPPKLAPTTQSSAPAAADVISASPSDAATEPSVEPTIDIAKLPTQKLSLEIITSSNDDPNAKSLHDALNKFTFKNLTMLTQSNISSSSTLVTFSNDIPSDVKNAILEEVRKVKTDVIVQEKQSSEYDIIVQLAK
jgi:hypothetical protein